MLRDRVMPVLEWTIHSLWEIKICAGLPDNGKMSSPLSSLSQTQRPVLSLEREELRRKFGRLNGEHPFKKENPGAFVDYPARKRKGGKVAYFNFNLAREMGLVPPHFGAESLTRDLQEVILDTFSLTIINEWDVKNRVQFAKEDILPGRYMATRYLQLQHPTRQGRTSGDGRGIWNGEVTHRGITWDVTSSGTGATCLSPATAKTGKFFRSGDPRVCYGNGYNSLDDGLAAALLSEALFAEGISTERVLALISFEDGSSINVRAGKNLLRPAHLFRPLKQGDRESLERIFRYCLKRDQKNSNDMGSGLCTEAWPQQVRAYCQKVARDFGIAAARYRTNYVFCWFDWDGDNILCDGGIIDYGSIRRFGAFHSGYRYDDGDRFSTRLAQQRARARYIVQTFAQIQEFLCTGQRPPIRSLRGHPLVRLFDEVFEGELTRGLLWKVGLSREQMGVWSKGVREKLPIVRVVKEFERAFRKVESLQTQKGVHLGPDGEVSYARFRMDVFLREYPRLRAQSGDMLGAIALSELSKSTYARTRDLKPTSQIKKAWDSLEKAYQTLSESFRTQGQTERQWMTQVGMRAGVRNPQERVTGDGSLAMMEHLLSLHRARKKGVSSIQRGLTLWQGYLHSKDGQNRWQATPLMLKLLKLVEQYSDSI